MNKKQFGQRLKELRMQRGMTQFELAEAVDLHEKHLSRIESGVYFPTFDNFMKIMQVLNLEWKDFDTKETRENNSLKNKAFKIIQRASEKELKLYVTTIEQLQKSLKDFENN